MFNRTMDGKNTPHEPVVAADIIAALAGVNRASVNKVIFALNLIKDAKRVGFIDLLDPASVPTEDPDQARVDATEKYLTEIVGDPHARKYVDDLRLRRFAR